MKEQEFEKMMNDMI